MLQDLIDRHGANAFINARPYVLDDGETLRWILDIQGEDVPDADVRILENPEGSDWVVMLLVCGDEEVEFMRWTTETYKYGPAQIGRRLGDLLSGSAFAE